jgi:hypothetical protein
MSDTVTRHLVELLSSRADWVSGGRATEDEPLEFVFRGESVTARVYARYNRSLVLALDVYVDDVDERPELLRWVATRSGVMPFAALHVDRPLEAGTVPAVLLVSHTLLADSVDGRLLDEVLDGMAYMARRARARVGEISSGDPFVIGNPEIDPDIDPDDALDDGAASYLEPVLSSTGRQPRRRAVPRSQAEVLADLHTLVGLVPVKSEIESLVRAQEVAEIRRSRGLAPNALSPHLVFAGNPGTGKTTVARLVGELYRSIGMLPSGHLVETDRAGLVAGYLGQTALKTRRVCERALGGVLFLDEAYTLAGGDRDYGVEAIETLLAFMENHRGELAVVVAGYPAEMVKFLRANPGLQSRFDLTIDFPDYTLDELSEIFLGLTVRHDYRLTAEAQDRVIAHMAAWPRHVGFGNGREVRKLFNEITRRHASLLSGAHPSTERLSTITADAVPSPYAPVVVPRSREHLGYL